MISCVILLSVFLHAEARCDIPYVKDASAKSGTIGFTYPTSVILNRQNCSWKLGSENSSGHILYVQIAKFDYREGRNCYASMHFADKKYCNMRRRCILFMRNNSKLDIDILDSKLKFGQQTCKSLELKHGDLEKVEIKTTHTNLTDFDIKLFYQYMATDNDVNSRYQVVNSDDEFQIKSKNYESSCDGFIAALSVVSVLLILASILLMFCGKMVQRNSIKRQPRARGSFYQTDSIDHEVDLTPVRSPICERKLSKSAFTRFSKFTGKTKNGSRNTNFIHFTLSRDEPDAPKRTKSLPDVQARYQINIPNENGCPGKPGTSS